MPEHSIEAAEVAPDRPRRRSTRPRRTDWRLGSRTVHRWREGLLGIALFSLGAGILAAFGALALGLGSTVATLLLWAGMLVAIVFALARSRPVGLFRFRPIDLLWAVGFGLILRTLQGWIEASVTGAALFPALTTVDGRLPSGWWFDGLLAPLLFAPPIEELFFRGVVLISLYSVLRRPLGGFTAGLTALLFSTALFVAAHAATGATSVSGTIAVAVLGAMCAGLVLLTGRIWAAIGVHLVYNLTGVLLTLVGTL